MERVVVTSILSESWGGSIFTAKTVAGKTVRVRTWEATVVSVGDTLDVDGTETTYRNEHGEFRQIEATAIFRTRTSGRLIIPWLMTLDGIGRERAEALFERYGNEVAQALGDPFNLSEIAHLLSPTRAALGRKLAEYVMAKFAVRIADDEVGASELDFLRHLEEAGVDDRKAARRLWRLIGSRDAFKRLLERPYAAAAVISWKEADALGLRLLKKQGVKTPETHEDRLLGAVDAVWRRTLRDGHTALTRAKLEALVKRTGVAARVAVDVSIEHRRTIAIDDDLLVAPGASYLEKLVAAGIARLKSGLPHVAWRGELPAGKLVLNDDQAGALESFRDRCFGILQGGAGVGKTTTMRALCDWHAASGGRVVQATISGKAALRLSRSTGRLAMTIARLVSGLEKRQALEERGEFAPDHLPRIDRETLVVVDEASMVDLVSWRKLIEFVPTGARLILVGDVAQLPPVGLGRVYHDLVDEASGVATLSTVMRQASDNPIVAVSALVRNGDVPVLSPFGGADRGVFHAACAQVDTAATAIRIYRDLASSTAKEDLLMVAGRRDTCAGIAKTMQAFRQSEGADGLRLGPLAAWVAVSDPVIATTNRYDEALMNGQLGWVEALDPLRIRFDGETEGREVSSSARLELASGWCLTVHRAQGSEAKRVIVILDAPTLITREWLYTAVTRGVEQVVLVGTREMIAAAVGRREERITGFGIELARAVVPSSSVNDAVAVQLHARLDPRSELNL